MPIEPMNAKPPMSAKKVGIASAAGGAVSALALMMSLTPSWEGERLDPYRDIVGKWTVCRGETEVEMRHYTPAECDAMSKRRFQEFLDYVASVAPGVEQYPFQHAAFADLAYNIGKAGFKKSSVVVLFRLGEHREACRKILLYKYAGGKVINGLQLRRTGDAARIGDYEMCLGDAVLADIQEKQ